MRCALVIPAWRPEELFPAKTASAQVNYWQPLGTLYVAACLREGGHEVRFYNGAFMGHDEILREVHAWRPDLAGLYATTFGWPKALRTARDLKANDRGLFVCVGGPYPIARPRDCLLDANGDVDAVVTGEGEQTLVELADRLATGRSLDGVAGVASWRDKCIVVNPPRPLIEDLDALPLPARDLLGDAGRYLPPPATYKRAPVAVMITSRGCNRRCIFCSQIDRERRAGNHGIRFRSVDSVVREIEQCLALGYREIKFLDDSLAADYERLMALTHEIRTRRLDFTWFASACVNQVDEPLLRAMKAAGCWAVLLGAESGVQKNLNTLRKGITLEQTRAAVKAAKAAGLRVSTPFVFGIPGETYDEALQTIEFAIELDPDLANFHALTAFPGTPLHDNLQHYGRVSARLDEHTYQGASFEPYTLTRAQIQALRRLAFRRFYSRPSFLARRLLGLRTWHDCKAAFYGARSLIGIWGARNPFERGEADPAST